MTRSPLRPFWVLWAGQTASLMGSALSDFAFGVWLYQQTGSIIDFGLMVFLRSLPFLLASPVAGVVIDRFNRRLVMLVADVAAGLNMMAIFLLLAAGRLEYWHVYAVVAVGSLLRAFQQNAYSAIIAQLVEPERRGRANGMAQLGQAISTVFVPMAAGFLLEVLGLGGIVLIDLATFFTALATLATLRVPDLAGTGEERAPLLREVTEGWRYIRASAALSSFLLVFALTNFSLGFLQVLFTPMVLESYSPSTLGLILGLGGCGMLTGGLWVGVTGGPRRGRARAIGILLLAGGLAVSATGLATSAILWSVTAFVYFFCVTTIGALAQTLWHNHVPEALHGKVFALSRMIGQSTVPVAYLVAPLLAEHVFEPAMAASGPLHGSLGTVLGTGPGRGIGVLFIVIGVTVVLVAAGALRHRGFRSLDP